MFVFVFLVSLRCEAFFDQGLNSLPQDRGTIFNTAVLGKCLLLPDPMLLPAPALGEYVMENRQHPIQRESELCFGRLPILEFSPERHKALGLVVR
jgi:hypothetical protein